MSVWAELAKQSGAIVLGATGIIGTYFASRSNGRETRHHSRLESTYGDLLHLLSNYAVILRTAEGGRQPSPDLRVKNISEDIGRVLALTTLYGSVDVGRAAIRSVEAIERSLDLAMSRPGGQRTDPQLEAQIADAITEMGQRISQLTIAMRADLAVPNPKLRSLRRG